MINYSLSLNEDDLRIIAAALNEAPYRIAAPVMNKLMAQVGEQRPADEPNRQDFLKDRLYRPEDGD